MSRRVLIGVGAVAVVAAVALGGVFGSPRTLPEGLIQATGRVEGDQVRVSTRASGRVAELPRREGEAVKAGDVLVRLDDAPTRARLSRATEAVAAAKAKAAEAQARLASARSRVAAQEAILALLRKELPIDVETTDASIKAADASVKAATALVESQKVEVARQRDARSKGAGSQSDLDDALRQLVLMEDNLSRFRTEKVKAEADHRKARELLPERLKAREAELAALRDAVAEAAAGAAAAAAAEKEAAAARDEADAHARELTVVAPVSGVVTARMVNPGEQVGANQPLLEIVDLDRLYMKVYLSGPDVGRIALGGEARLYTDAFPDQAVPATVRFISSVAEFTPKEVATPDERVKLVYAVKLYLNENPDGRVKPGMPADAALRWKDGVEWQKPRW